MTDDHRLDPDRPAQLAEDVSVGARQQAVIDDLHASHGGKPVEVVDRALRRALADSGLARPPEPWLAAVAAELAAGHVYVVGTGLAPGDRFSSASGRREES
jgi:hypothetical protein